MTLNNGTKLGLYEIQSPLGAGSKLRLAVQLVDAVSGAHLWAENYERPFNPDTVFELQDELVPRIVSTIADAHGILPHTMSEGIRGKSPEQSEPV